MLLLGKQKTWGSSVVKAKAAHGLREMTWPTWSQTFHTEEKEILGDIT